jgi:hypothetical protein
VSEFEFFFVAAKFRRFRAAVALGKVAAKRMAPAFPSASAPTTYSKFIDLPVSDQAARARNSRSDCAGNSTHSV